MKNLFIAFTLIFGMFLGTGPAMAQVDIHISITAGVAPPPLPVYVQPACPTDGFFWIPGYWSYTDNGFFWVPGIWVSPPRPGFLWTPGYWGFAAGVYGFHSGYWGQHIGFYGGVNYGYGYSGSGFGGGRWEGNSFRYNTAVVNVNQSVVHNTYVDKTVIINNTTVINNRTSYNGGPQGLSTRPTVQEQAVQRENHLQATQEQNSHVQNARSNPAQFASANHGNPGTLAMNKPNGQAFNAHGSQSASPPKPNHNQLPPEHDRSSVAHTQHQPDHNQKENKSGDQQSKPEPRHAEPEHAEREK